MFWGAPHKPVLLVWEIPTKGFPVRQSGSPTRPLLACWGDGSTGRKDHSQRKQKGAELRLRAALELSSLTNRYYCFAVVLSTNPAKSLCSLSCSVCRRYTMCPAP